MNIKKKGASLAFTATLLASLLATVAAPAVSGATTVGSAGVVPRAGTSSGTATFTFTEETATCFVAVPADAAAVTNPSLRVTIYDVDDPIPAGPSEVSFSGTPVVTAPGSLGATASISGNVLSVSFTNSSDAIIEQVTISGLTISAAAGAESGAIAARLDGSQAACVVPAAAATVTATGSLPFAIAGNAASTFITNTVGSCPFVRTGFATGAVTAGPLVFASNPESVRILTVVPGPPGSQFVTFQNASAVSSTGTSDAGTTATVLTDAGATWVGDQTGRVLRYTSGPAAGQPEGLVITANTATTITTAAFAPAPAAGGGDTYEILAPTVAASGTSDAGTTATVLTDAGAAWSGSQVGRFLRYTSGPAAGLQEVITANTATTITTAAFAPAPTPGGGDTYQIFSQGATNTHSPGELVSQTGVPQCNPLTFPTAIGSPGIVADVLTQSGVGTIPQVVPGESNQPARSVALSEAPSGSATSFVNGQVVTFTISNPASGVVFSNSPTLTGPGPSAVCSLSIDRRSCTATIAGATAGSDTYTLTGILVDVAGTVPLGTPVRITASVSSGIGVNGAPTTVANVGRVVVGVAAQPTVYIGENDQSSGMITLTESGPGFFVAGAGSNNTFALCLATGETFTRAPWAVVTNAGGTPGLQLLSGVVGASQVQGTLYNGGMCAYWTVYSASTTGPATIEIRGSADGTTPLPSGANNGPRLSVPPGLAPGTTQAAILIGTNAAVVGSGGCSSVPGCQANAAFSSMVTNAVRAFRSGVVVSAVSQPVIDRGDTDALGGNITITETINGQFKPGQVIFVQVLARGTTIRQDVLMNTANTNNQPIITTNSASGLTTSPPIFGGITPNPIVCQNAIPLIAICGFAFTINQQSFGPTLGQITISNIHYFVLPDAVNGAVQVQVSSSGLAPGPNGVAFQSVVSNARVGAAQATQISNGSATGVHVAGDGAVFTTRTKIVQAGKYVTWRADMDPASAGERLEVWIARRDEGSLTWSPYVKVTTRAVNSAGLAFFYWKTSDTSSPFTNQAGWISVRFKFLGNANHAAFTSLSRQAHFTP